MQRWMMAFHWHHPTVSMTVFRWLNRNSEHVRNCAENKPIKQQRQHWRRNAERRKTHGECVCVLPSKWWQWWREQIYNKYSDISLTHTQIRIKWMNLSFSNSIRTAESEIGSIWIYIRRRAKCETLWERGRSTHMGQRTAQIERKTLLRSKNTQAEEKHKSRKKTSHIKVKIRIH